MSREADYTIKGFIYQFNKTLEQVLSEPNGTEITVEGIIEDIDVVSAGLTKAIQCKYHETKEKYKSSDISKPILQMLVHYAKNKDKNIQYILYAHFSDETEGEKTISKSDIETILKSKDKSYLNYISELKPPKTEAIKALLLKPKKSAEDIKKITTYYGTATDLELKIDIDNFLKPESFKFIIGKSFDSLIIDIKQLLETKSGFTKVDIEELFYPNAIQKIANKSILHNPEDRKINNTNFISGLEKSKKTAITRWTRELLTYSKLLTKRRSQLKLNLQANHRQRYFLFNESNIEDFENKIVKFISEYISKYHYKIKLHSKTPVFSIKTENDNLIPQIESRLHQKGLKFQNGLKGNDFFQGEFLREPTIISTKNWREFQLRICNYNIDSAKAINTKKSDDLFLIGKEDFEQIDKQDINIEVLEVSNLNELQYLLMLTDNFE
ncbi:hypothetical protein [Polaribacter sp. AHE13PA]|uniref:hypothetical protein n=1 Tax=Polaribacter sp. AHE13PA TaxID=2745562 RepID=UPI001C4EBE1D|nr:hypothetical protein [Polaribacter sp. AHE13PA]QXP67828.1 hypothetical protein H0I28_04830 [Polaribacter sp. AHE13PA]